MTTIGSGRAYGHIRMALRNGSLPRITAETKCVDCGSQATGYDHRDYNKPLDVEPVCQRCNVRRGPAIPYRGSGRKVGKIHFHIQTYARQRLAAISLSTDISTAEHIRRAIEAYLDRLKEK